MQFPVTIGLHRSRFLDVALCFLALMATAAALAYPRPIVVQAGLALVAWIFCGLAWWRLTPALTAVRLEHTGRILIRDNGANEFVATKLLPGATVHPWLSVFRLKTDSERCYTLIVAVDSLNREDFRRLRVFLRWQVDFNAPDDDA